MYNGSSARIAQKVGGSLRWVARIDVATHLDGAADRAAASTSALRRARPCRQRRMVLPLVARRPVVLGRQSQEATGPISGPLDASVSNLSNPTHLSQPLLRSASPTHHPLLGHTRPSRVPRRHVEISSSGRRRTRRGRGSPAPCLARRPSSALPPTLDFGSVQCVLSFALSQPSR